MEHLDELQQSYENGFLTSFNSKYCTRNIFNVVALGSSFCIFFTAFNTTQNYITELKKNLGFWTLAVLYFFFAIFNFFSPAVIDKIGPRVSMIVGGIPYVLFVLASCFTNSIILIGSAVLLGLGAATLWTAHGEFLTQIAGAEMGAFSGIFFGIFQMSGIIGNLLTGALMKMGVSIFWIFFILFCIAAVGVSMLLLLFVLPVNNTDDEKKMKKRSKSISQSIRKTIQVMLNSKMVLFLPISLYSGYSVSVFTGVLPPIIAKHGGRDMISWVMTLYGLAEALGSIAFGKLIDLFGRRIMMFITMLLHITAVLLCWFMLYGGNAMFFITLFFCGLADSGLNTSIYSILGSPAYFKKKAGDAFAAFKLVQSIASAGGFLSSNFATIFTIKITISAVCASAVLSFIILDFFVAASDADPAKKLHAINDATYSQKDVTNEGDGIFIYETVNLQNKNSK